MTVVTIDCDRRWRELASTAVREDVFGAQPRKSKYGSADGLVPYGDAYPDGLVDESDYKEVIEDAHLKQMFPLYHQRASWCPAGKRWNQNGLPYCWAWGMTSALMDCRSREGKPTVLLSPISLGWLVGWRSRGNYLESAIRGAKERGICSQSFTPSIHERNPKSFDDGWEEDAMLYRLSDDGVWDLDNRSNESMIRYAISVLRTGTPLYIAYNWWHHALECVGVRWDESQKNNLVWQIRNSHNESDIIELTGSRGVPSEAFGIRSTITIS